MSGKAILLGARTDTVAEGFTNTDGSVRQPPLSEPPQDRRAKITVFTYENERNAAHCHARRLFSSQALWLPI